MAQRPPTQKTDGGSDNPIEAYFDGYSEGPGIWKWKHYFEIYHRHLAKFTGRPANILEIGIYSGGSLRMWHAYFGSRARIFGVDIEPACKSYENEFTTILIGDQGDRRFWDSVTPQLPPLDVVIDDGGHEFEQQKVTLEALWPKISPGGVYLCEDILREGNKFTSLVHSLSDRLNSTKGWQRYQGDPERREACRRTAFQGKVHSIHQYPFVAVIEMNEEGRMEDLVAPKRGSSWEPFLT